MLKRFNKGEMNRRGREPEQRQWADVPLMSREAWKWRPAPLYISPPCLQEVEQASSGPATAVSRPGRPVAHVSGPVQHRQLSAVACGLSWYLVPCRPPHTARPVLPTCPVNSCSDREQLIGQQPWAERLARHPPIDHRTVKPFTNQQTHFTKIFNPLTDTSKAIPAPEGYSPK